MKPHPRLRTWFVTFAASAALVCATTTALSLVVQPSTPTAWLGTSGSRIHRGRLRTDIICIPDLAIQRAIELAFDAEQFPAPPGGLPTQTAPSWSTYSGRPEGTVGGLLREGAVGFPFRCMACSVWNTFDKLPSTGFPLLYEDGTLARVPLSTAQARSENQVLCVLENGFLIGGSRILPTRILLAGMAGNVLVYAVALSAFVYAWRRGVRIWRGRRHRCIKCGYDRSGLAPFSPCPECGTTPPVAADGGRLEA